MSKLSNYANVPTSELLIIAESINTVSALAPRTGTKRALIVKLQSDLKEELARRQ